MLNKLNELPDAQYELVMSAILLGFLALVGLGIWWVV